jgi:hypothetical protein
MLEVESVLESKNQAGKKALRFYEDECLPRHSRTNIVNVPILIPSV